MHRFSLITAASVLTLAHLPALAGEPVQKTKQYRPLEAKAVHIETAARADPAMRAQNRSAVELKRAWKHFDLREWDEAHDAFYTVLELDPVNVPAAEGLAMTLYQSGDYTSAFRLGEELGETMPSVREIVGETLLADVRFMIKKGEFEAANEFLAYFPANGDTVVTARRMVADANTITTAIGPEGDFAGKPVTQTVPATNLVNIR